MSWYDPSYRRARRSTQAAKHPAPSPSQADLRGGDTVKRTAWLRSSVAIGASLIVAACAGGPSPTPAATPTPTPAPTETAIPTPVIAAPTSLITAGTVVDCVDIEYPPMEYFPSADVTDPAQAIGFDVDSAKAVGLGWGVQNGIPYAGCI